MPNESIEVRLARMEERQKAHIQSTDENFSSLSKTLGEFVDTQTEANKAFWDSRNKVIIMEAKKAGAKWVVGAFGTLTVGTAAAVAWLYEHWPRISAALFGGKS